MNPTRNRSSLIYILFIVAIAILLFFNFQQNLSSQEELTINQVAMQIKSGQISRIVEDDNQLLHLTRYIHLNPLSSLVVKKRKDLLEYPWSSFPQYLRREKGFCETETALSHFSDSKSYRQFVFDRADYQKEIQKLKHLLLERKY